MKYWFRGKRGGLVAFLAIAVLVAGGLGWVTADALRLERQELKARVEADLSSKLRIGLWRLDSRMVTVFTNEANRPYSQFCVREISTAAPGKGAPPATALELAPLADLQPPSWMGRHFVVAPRRDWQSSRALRDALVRQLGILPSPNPLPKGEGLPASGAEGFLVRAPASQQFLGELSSDQTLQRLLTQVRQEDSQLNQARQQSQQPPLNNSAQQLQEETNATRNGINSPPAQSAIPQSNGQNTFSNTAQQRRNRDTDLRYSVRAESFNQNYIGNLENAKPSGNSRSARQDPVVLGPLIPLWLTVGQEERLVAARLIQVGPKLACHVTLLEWPELQTVLAEHVADLFPEARFLPIHNEQDANPERAMTALPVELDPGSREEAQPSGGSPMRVGLALAWTAAVIALVAVGLGGWSLLDLSERRVRFVSAVTHELRTPLTTLRLYLDMLTGGVVREENQKNEYLHTLHAQADRLHRLVGNVLDFSRLENQRPRLEKTTVQMSDLLDQVRAAWQERCSAADKELVIDNQAAGLALCSDIEIIRQILGNLIDNACKYSADAADRRIRLRTYRKDSGGIVFEVEDGGPGVPPSEWRLIFRPFRRGRSADVVAGGVGLGLALAQRWAQLLGGRLSLRKGSTQPGACFQLELPLGKDPSAG